MNKKIQHRMDSWAFKMSQEIFSKYFSFVQWSIKHDTAMRQPPLSPFPNTSFHSHKSYVNVISIYTTWNFYLYSTGSWSIISLSMDRQGSKFKPRPLNLVSLTVLPSDHHCSPTGLAVIVSMVEMWNLSFFPLHISSLYFLTLLMVLSLN